MLGLITESLLFIGGVGFTYLSRLSRYKMQVWVGRCRWMA